MIANIAILSAVSVVLVAAQTNLLWFMAIGGALPDLALILLVYYAHHNGSFPGEIVGFVTGIAFDALGAAPLGFHALMYTAVGYAVGILRQRVAFDPIFAPVLFVALSTLFKALVGFILLAVFPVQTGFEGVISPSIGIEVGYNAILTPLIFALLGLIRPLRSRRRSTIL